MPMKLYAEVPYFRTRQILLDVAVLLWVAVWVRVGMRVHELVSRLSEPGRDLENAGSGFAKNLDEVSERVPELPFVGGALRTPFTAAADAGRALEAAGQTHQDVIATLALWLGVLLALIPILYALIRYLPDRTRWVRDASAAQRLRLDAEDLHLFALRAVATRPLHELRRACPDPARALASGDYRPLAELELGALGLTAEDLDKADRPPGKESIS